MNKILKASLIVLTGFMLMGCGAEEASTKNSTKADMEVTTEIAGKLSSNQPTPSDIDYSLERYSLIKRAYWVNGQREQALALTIPIERPLGYIVLFSNSGSVVGTFTVDGKVSSLNSYLTPQSEKYEQEYGSNGYSRDDGNQWLSDVDGSYGVNDDGIFFFTNDGKYIEWTGIYLYSDIPFIVENPILEVGK